MEASPRQNSGAGTLAVEAEVLGTRAPRRRRNRGFLDLAITTRNQNGDELITQTWSLIVPTRQSAPSGVYLTFAIRPTTNAQGECQILNSARNLYLLAVM